MDIKKQENNLLSKTINQNFMFNYLKNQSV